VKWDLATVAAAVSGTAAGTAVVTAVVTDSRAAGPGALFVALAGERYDGHDFVSAALAAGAAAVLVERGRLPEGEAGVEADDTVEALRRLAVLRRGELTMPVVAITGSSGKTTTKDLLHAALGPRAHAAPRSYNNEIGVPLTVLATPDDAAALVIEVGSRGRGHIALLAPAIRPEVAVLTQVGRAHLETFGDAATVLAAKWELVEALGPEGTAVLPAEEDRVAGRWPGRVLTFGEVASADVSVSAVALDDRGRASFTIAHAGERCSARLSAAGRHMPRNAAAAVAAAVALQVPFTTAVDRVGAAGVSPWRMEVCPGAVTVVNDAYNANPDSMESALLTVAAMPGRGVAVLGKMHELGDAEAHAHHEVGALARELGFAAVVVVGDDPGIAEGAGPIGCRVADRDEAEEVLGRVLRPGDVVLVKASRAVGLEVLAERLCGGAP